MNEKLKPCPFCGNPDAPELCEDGYDLIPYIVCNARNGGCGTSVYAQEEFPGEPTKESAIALWNNPYIRNDTIEECVGWLSDKIEYGELDPLWLRDNMSIALKDEL